MRDGTVVEGQVQIGEDQSLVSHLNSRRAGWVILTRAMRAKGDEYPGHMILQGQHVVIASAPDHNVVMATGTIAGTVERGVEIVLVGGRMIQGYLHAAAQQRLSDVVSAFPHFVAVSRAVLQPEGRALGDIVLQSGAVAFVRDLRTDTAPGDAAQTETENW